MGCPSGPVRTISGRSSAPSWASVRTVSGRLTALGGASYAWRFLGVRRRFGGGPMRTTAGCLSALRWGSLCARFQAFRGLSVGSFSGRLRATLGRSVRLLVRTISGVCCHPWRPCTGRPSAARRASSGPALSHFFGSCQALPPPSRGRLVRRGPGRPWDSCQDAFIPVLDPVEAPVRTPSGCPFSPARDIRVPCADPPSGPLSGSSSPASPDPSRAQFARLGAPVWPHSCPPFGPPSGAFRHISGPRRDGFAPLHAVKKPANCDIRAHS